MSKFKAIVSTSSSGLANRLRAHSSVFRVGRRLCRDVAIHWPLTNQLNARFSDLFKSVWPIADQERIENWVFRTELSTKVYNCRQTNHIQLDDSEDVLVIKSWDFFDTVGFDRESGRRDDILELRMLRPVDDVETVINSVHDSFHGRPYIGVHIRTGDIIGVHFGERPVPEKVHQWFSSGPDSFIAEVSPAVSEGFGLFVSSDDPECEMALEKAFPGNVVTLKKSTEWRKSAVGMKEAVADLYALSKAKAVIGSKSSQFSLLAAELGNIPLFIAGDGKFSPKLI